MGHFWFQAVGIRYFENHFTYLDERKEYLASQTAMLASLGVHFLGGIFFLVSTFFIRRDKTAVDNIIINNNNDNHRKEDVVVENGETNLAEFNYYDTVVENLQNGIRKNKKKIFLEYPSWQIWSNVTTMLSTCETRLSTSVGRL